MYAAFPRAQYYDRSAPLPSHQPQAGPSQVVSGTTTVVPRFRVMPSSSGGRLPLCTRTVLSAPAMDLLGLHPDSQRHSVAKSTFPWTHTIPGTVHLSPSLSVGGLVPFRMLQTRVPRVALARLRLAASGQDRVSPDPHVSRASGCLCLVVHNLPGQPHLCGGMGGWLPCRSPPFLGRIHHCMTQLPGARMIRENDRTLSDSR
jgi:hypothetical protein